MESKITYCQGLYKPRSGRALKARIFSGTVGDLLNGSGE
jgi:hypothetical protein